jgi:hypothetical protein
MGRSVYEQPGTEVDGSCHSKEGSKEVEGNKGEQKGIKEKENRKQGNCS